MVPRENKNNAYGKFGWTNKECLLFSASANGNSLRMYFKFLKEMHFILSVLNSSVFYSIFSSKRSHMVTSVLTPWYIKIW